MGKETEAEWDKATSSVWHSLWRWSEEFQPRLPSLSPVTMALLFHWSQLTSCFLFQAYAHYAELSLPLSWPPLGMTQAYLDLSFVGHLVPLETMVSNQRVPMELSESTLLAPTLTSGTSKASERDSRDLVAGVFGVIFSSIVEEKKEERPEGLWAWPRGLLESRCLIWDSQSALFSLASVPCQGPGYMEVPQSRWAWLV